MVGAVVVTVLGTEGGEGELGCRAKGKSKWIGKVVEVELMSWVSLGVNRLHVESLWRAEMGIMASEVL